MKKISVILLSFLFIQTLWADISTPRDTFKTYLKAMVKIKNHEGDPTKNYKVAIKTFQGNPDFSEGSVYADQLIKVLDKI
jgi:hypothetical protein